MRPRISGWFEAYNWPAFWVPDYWFMLTLGIIVGCLVTLRLCRSRDRPGNPARKLLFVGIPALFIGARFFHFLQFGFPEDPLSFFLTGGASFYGGLFGLLGTWFLWARFEEISLLDFLDVVTPGLAWGLALGRVGCFLAGCDGGVVAGLPWAVRFPPGTSSFVVQVREGLIEPDRVLSLPAHPTQLYEALFALLVGGLLLQLLRSRRFKGEVFLTGMLWYGAFRFTVEFLRADLGGWHPFGLLTFSQFFSLILVLVATLGFKQRSDATCR